MAGLLGRLVFRTRVVTTWIDSLPLRGHGLPLPITTQPGCTCACRRYYRNSPTWLQDNVAATTNGRSNEHELTAEERRRIDELWKSQEPLGAIAKTMNKRLSVVWKHLLGSSSGPRPSFEWSDDEHNKLRELREQGCNYKETAEKLGRPYRSTRSYVNRARCTSAAGRTNVYSLEQRDQAVNLLKEGLRPNLIAQRLGVPVIAVAHMLRDRRRIHNWTTEEVEQVLTLKEAGSPWQEIQAVLSGPSENAIRSLYSRLALARHCSRPASAKLASVNWSSEENAKLLRLRNEHRLTFPQIWRQMPGRSETAIRSRYSAMDASLKGGLAYSLEDLEKIARLRAKGMIWREVAAHIPGRTVHGVRHVFRKECLRKGSVDERGNIKWHGKPPRAKLHGRQSEA